MHSQSHQEVHLMEYERSSKCNAASSNCSITEDKDHHKEILAFREENEIGEHQPVAVVAKLEEIHVPPIELERDVSVNHKAQHHKGSVSVNEVVRVLCDKVCEQDEKVDAEDVHILVEHTLERSFAHLFLKTVLFLFEARHDPVELFIVLDFVNEASSSVAHLD